MSCVIYIIFGECDEWDDVEEGLRKQVLFAFGAM